MEVSVYDEYVPAHILAIMEYHIHDDPAFLPWHRVFVRSFELELEAIYPDMSVPCWDFTIDVMPLVGVTPADMLDYRALGYDYALHRG